MGLARSMARVLIRNDPSCADREATVVAVWPSAPLAVTWAGSFALDVAPRLPHVGTATLVGALIEVAVVVARCACGCGSAGGARPRAVGSGGWAVLSGRWPEAPTGPPPGRCPWVPCPTPPGLPYASWLAGSVPAGRAAT